MKKIYMHPCTDLALLAPVAAILSVSNVNQAYAEQGSQL